MSKIIRFSLSRTIEPTAPDGLPGVRYGILKGDSVQETPSPDSSERGRTHRLAEIRLLPPCHPSKIVCVGRNYLEHARELGNEPPAEPLIFLKPPSSLIASGDAIVYPPISRRVDYEGELGLVIGRRARNVRREEAMACVLGYTCVNDVTARDLQKKDGQWTRGKGFDTFCAVGPCMTLREHISLDSIRIRTSVDGEVKQDAGAGEMIFPPDVIIAYVSEFMTLEPGDLIATGTPPGVGPLEIGSEVSVEIEGIGLLQNWVIRG